MEKCENELEVAIQPFPYNDFHHPELSVNDIQITLLDVPRPPEKVVVYHVFEKSCVIDWSQPKDDGGSTILKYVIERQIIERQSVVENSWEKVGEVPNRLQKTYQFTDLTPGKIYLFRVRAIIGIGQSEAATIKNFILAKNPWGDSTKAKILYFYISQTIHNNNNYSSSLLISEQSNCTVLLISDQSKEEYCKKDDVMKSLLYREALNNTEIGKSDLDASEQNIFHDKTVNEAVSSEPHKGSLKQFI